MSNESFADPDAVARYADGPRRMVPGHDGLLAMTGLLLAETVPDDGRVFVLGAGGGLEMAHFAALHAGWRFVGVDPSAPMLDLARQAVGDRAELICGYVSDAPPGPFDGAVCILVLHFVPLAERLATLQAVRSRLRPGAPFVCAHFSVAGDAAERAQWFARYAAFAEQSGIARERALLAAAKIGAELPILSPDEDEALLVEAGFTQVRQFYAAFTFRGWVCEA